MTISSWSLWPTCASTRCTSAGPTFDALAARRGDPADPGSGGATQAIYRAIGVTDCIAASLDDYVSIACLGTDAEYAAACPPGCAGTETIFHNHRAVEEWSLSIGDRVSSSVRSATATPSAEAVTARRIERFLQYLIPARSTSTPSTSVTACLSRAGRAGPQHCRRVGRAHQHPRRYVRGGSMTVAGTLAVEDDSRGPRRGATTFHRATSNRSSSVRASSCAHGATAGRRRPARPSCCGPTAPAAACPSGAYGPDLRGAGRHQLRTFMRQTPSIGCPPCPMFTPACSDPPARVADTRVRRLVEHSHCAGLPQVLVDGFDLDARPSARPPRRAQLRGRPGQLPDARRQRSGLGRPL
jgi:hypothetical protein